MELKQFVKETLLDIYSAVDEVTQESGKEFFVQACIEGKVQFDVAVEVSDSIGAAAEGSVKGGIISVAQVNMGGDVKIDQKNSHITRIKFGINNYK